MNAIPVRLGIQQRVLPAYRAPFFDALAARCERGLQVFYGDPRPDEMIPLGALPQQAQTFRGVNRHTFSGKLYLYWQSGLIQWLETWQPEVLILEANPRNLTVPVAARWMHRRGRPVIGWGLGSASFEGVAGRLRRWFYHSFDAMISYSAQGAGEYRQAGFAPERVFMAPNAVAARPTRPLPERPEYFATGRPIFLYVGRLQARKRLDLMLQACAQMPQPMQPRLWLVGDGPARADLEQLAGRIYPSAEFLGELRGEALEPFFWQADLFILPGTGGLAVQEAMSFGLPVVVGEADGTQSDLVRPENGWQIPPGNLDALASTLVEAISDIGRLRRMGAASYRIVAEEINLEQMVAGFERAVRAVLGGQSAHTFGS